MKRSERGRGGAPQERDGGVGIDEKRVRERKDCTFILHVVYLELQSLWVADVNCWNVLDIFPQS